MYKSTQNSKKIRKRGRSRVKECLFQRKKKKEEKHLTDPVLISNILNK